MSRYQPRYEQFVRQTGGGANWQFIIWINAKWAEFLRCNPSTLYRSQRHQEFDLWLSR